MWANQLKTSGRSRPVATRPSGPPPTGRMARARPPARTIAQPGVITSESPAIQSRSLCLGVNAWRRGFGGGVWLGLDVVGVLAGVVAGGGLTVIGGVKEIVVSILSSFL